MKGKYCEKFDDQIFMKVCFLIALLSYSVVLSAASPLKSESQTSVWINQSKKHLQAVVHSEKQGKASLDLHKARSPEGLYRYHPLSGYIEFDDGSWVLLLSHTAHLEDGIGHASVLRTSNGTYYSNRGNHNPKILLYSKVEIKSLRDFLASFGLDDKGQKQPRVKM